jgi:small-conductance mechanosensitive channel
LARLSTGLAETIAAPNLVLRHAVRHTRRLAMDVLQTSFYDNTVMAWLLAAGVAIVVYVALRVAQRVTRMYLESFARRTNTDIDDVAAGVLAGTKEFFLLFVAVYAGTRVLAIAPSARTAIKFVGVTVVFLQLALWGNALIEGLLRRRVRRTLEHDPGSATTMQALGFIGRLILWTVLLLMALANLEVEIGPLLTGLGVGGIAVALAVQNILGDLFASLSIVLDKPFVIGDFIIVGEHMGSVEHVGLKTTRVRSLSGEQLVFANSDLLSARIRNFKRMYERRVVFTVGVTYQTPRAQLAAIPGMIREIVEGQEKARFDRSHFKAYGAFSIDFETVFYVLDPDFNLYMDVQQAINLAIHERFEQHGIEFAYPTQTLFVEKVAGLQPAAT